MAPKSKNKQILLKKKTSDAKEYRNFIENSSYSPDSTVPVSNEFLRGSAEWDSHSEELNSSAKIKKTPFKYRFTDWLKNNIFPTIITTVVIAIGTAVIAHQVNIAVINTKIEYIEKEISSLQDNSVDKEILSLKLSEIEAKLDSNHMISLNEIKWQLDELQEQIQDLRSDANEKEN